jgi:hypothetical protein
MRRIAPSSGALALLIALTSIACGGGGGGGGGGNPGGGGPTSPPGVNFTTNGSITANSIYLSQGGGTSASRLVIDVRANSVEALYGAAYDIVFPTSMLSFTKATEGGFQKGSTSFQAAIGSPGRLIVGQTNLGADEPESGSGLLATLEFAVIGNGSAPVSFDNEQAFRNGSVPQNVNFISGNLTVSN